MSKGIVEITLSNFHYYENALTEFLQASKFGRFQKQRFDFFNIQLEVQSLLNYIQSANLLIDINEENKIIGLIGFHHSSWDSNIFNKKVAIIKYFLSYEENLYDSFNSTQNLIDEFHIWSTENLINAVIVKVETDYSSCIKSLNENGYTYYETITLQTKNNLKDINKSIKYRFANKSDIEPLKTIALDNTFKKSHFYLDSEFEPEAVNNVYSTWIESSLKSRDKILIIESENKIAGMFIYSIEIVNGVIYALWKFAAIEKSFRGKGLGNNLFQGTIHACKNEGAQFIDTSLAVKNTISLKIHSRLGFIPVMSLVTYHKWF